MGNDDIRVDVDLLAQRLMRQQDDAAATEQQRVMLSKHRVGRVPSDLRFGKRNAYTPGLVAIGPLHAGESFGRLRPGHRLKMAYLYRLISRGHPDPVSHLGVIQGYVRLVAAREREARGMYAADEDVDDISPEDLVHMMVLDGCFIIEHLVNFATNHEEQMLHTTPFGPTQLSVDLILAENQLPFFVLVDLINNTRLPEFDTTGLTPTALLMKMVLYYLAGDMGRDMSSDSADGVSHILHLLHTTVTEARKRWKPPPRAQPYGVAMMGTVMRTVMRLLRHLPLLLLVPLLYPITPEDQRWSARYGREDLPSASDLKRMWVRFKRTRSGGRKLAAGIAAVLGPVPLAVKLEHEDCLRLPRLRIEFRTAPMLLNLIAFEQAVEQRFGDVSAYAWFMGAIVRSPEDARFLAAEEVVQSTTTTGSESREDVARFFREVGAASEAVEGVEKSYLGKPLQKLRKRRRRDPVLTMWVDIQRYYVDRQPWRIVVAFVTIVTTVATVLQTVAAFKQKPGG